MKEAIIIILIHIYFNKFKIVIYKSTQHLITLTILYSYYYGFTYYV